MTTAASVRIAREAPAETSFTIDTMLRKMSTPCAPVVMIVAVRAASIDVLRQARRDLARWRVHAR